MIPIDRVFQTVSALSRKGSTGYHSNDDFNNQIILAQTLLFGWYFEQYEKNQSVPDALIPFLEQPVLPIVAGLVAYPANYRHRIEVQVGYTSAGATTWHSCPYVKTAAEILAAERFVRRPNVEKRRFAHTLAKGGIKVLPESFDGVVKFKYLADPPAAVRAVTVNVAQDVENYNPVGSVDLIWGAQDEQNIIDILLYLKGVQTRQSELIQWVSRVTA